MQRRLELLSEFDTFQGVGASRLEGLGCALSVFGEVARRSVDGRGMSNSEPFRAPLLSTSSSVHTYRKHLPTSELSELDTWTSANSLIPTVRDCAGDPFRKAHCKRLTCSRCSTERAKKLDSLWAERIGTRSNALVVGLSVAPSYDIATAFQDLARTRAQFGKRSWLSSISSSWIRSTELTHGLDAWHWHDSLLVFGTDDELDRIETTVAARWVDAAHHVGVFAAESAVYARRARSVAGSRKYFLKGIGAPSTGRTRGSTVGDLQRDAASGHLRAKDLFHEVELFLLDHSRGVRLVSHGAGFRELDLG